jgi:hypothetical protein
VCQWVDVDGSLGPSTPDGHPAATAAGSSAAEANGMQPLASARSVFRATVLATEEWMRARGCGEDAARGVCTCLVQAGIAAHEWLEELASMQADGELQRFAALIAGGAAPSSQTGQLGGGGGGGKVPRKWRRKERSRPLPEGGDGPTTAEGAPPSMQQHVPPPSRSAELQQAKLAQLERIREELSELTGGAQPTRTPQPLPPPRGPRGTAAEMAIIVGAQDVAVPEASSALPLSLAPEADEAAELAVAMRVFEQEQEQLQLLPAVARQQSHGQGDGGGGGGGGSGGAAAAATDHHHQDAIAEIEAAADAAQRRLVTPRRTAAASPRTPSPPSRDDGHPAGGMGTPLSPLLPPVDEMVSAWQAAEAGETGSVLETHTWGYQWALCVGWCGVALAGWLAG